MIILRQSIAELRMHYSITLLHIELLINDKMDEGNATQKTVHVLRDD